MHAATALAALSRMGLAVRPLGDRLFVTPRDRITPEARALIVEHRAGLLKLVGSDHDRGAAVSPFLSAATLHVPAAADAGPQFWQARAEWHRVAIGVALGRLPPASDHNGRRLTTATRKFLASPLFNEAIGCGWALEELFGVDCHAPLDIFERWGLVVGLALAPRRNDVIDHIDGECAVIRFRDGVTAREQRRIERRFYPEADSILWWECHDLVGDVE